MYLHPLDSVPLFFRKWIAIHTGMTRHTAMKKKKKKTGYECIVSTWVIKRRRVIKCTLLVFFNHCVLLKFKSNQLAFVTSCLVAMCGLLEALNLIRLYFIKITMSGN